MNKQIRKLLSILCVAALAISIMAGCATTSNSSDDNASPDSSPEATTSASATTEPTEEASEDTFADKHPAGTSVELKYAENFSIEYLEDGMKLVTDGQGVQTLLLQEGQTAPEEYADLTALTIPLSDVIYTSTTQVGYLRAFDDDTLFDSIIGVRATIDTWDFDAMISRMESGQIIDVGSNTTMSTSYDYEIIQSLNPYVIFTNNGISTEQNELRLMLDEVGIPYVFDNSSQESDYRGIMEWIKFFAAFYNLEDEAATYFDAAMANIDDIISVTSALADDEKVKVGWGIVAMGKIYVENGGSSSAQMVRDCGGIYVFDDISPDVDGVTELTAEEFYERMSEADIFINRGMPKYGPDIDSILESMPVLAEIACIQEGTVLQITDQYWNSYHNIDGKYYEMSEFFYPDLFDLVTTDAYTHFRIEPQTAE